MKNYDDLLKKYPLLFKAHGLSSIKLFGFECDIGWYELIDNVCNIMYAEYKSALQSVVWYKQKIRNKNYDNYCTEEYCITTYKKHKQTLREHRNSLPVFSQIKEKFGGLRLYINHGNPYVHGAITMAECISYSTCEKCGQKGRRYTMGWHKTLCKEHAIERYGADQVAAYEKEEEE